MKLWDGRFNKGTSSLTEMFNGSIQFDYKLFDYDIQGSIAHSKMLERIGILTKEESDTIIKGLEEIKKEYYEGKIEFKIEYEDIHMNVEKILTDKIGELGKKLHTARSRNDQVAVDMKLYFKDNAYKILDKVEELLKTILQMSEENVSIIMPGYTHLQGAQPIRLGFHLMAYFMKFKRDYTRILNCIEGMDELPLGSGALAGTNYDTDREFLKEELDFKSVSLNAMDSVSERDYIIEFQSAISILFMHLSRISEEIIIWNSQEYGFIDIDDAYCTGSSIMPQKKNPDIPELIRGKTGRIYGNLIQILTVLKGLPLAYNKDLQEDKESLFDTVETTLITLEIFNELLKNINFNEEAMFESTKKGYLNSTDLADYLVGKGIGFRDAHKVVGSIVAYGLKESKTLEAIDIEVYKSYCTMFENDLYDFIDMKKTVDNKKSFGSTSEKSLLISIDKCKEWIEKL
jgi:argininosuccinate lyase